MGAVFVKLRPGFMKGSDFTMAGPAKGVYKNVSK